MNLPKGIMRHAVLFINRVCPIAVTDPFVNPKKMGKNSVSLLNITDRQTLKTYLR